MVIDVHSHILPGIDDGAQSMDDTIAMLAIAHSEGIGGIWATAHYEAGMEEDYLERYERAYEQAAAYIEQQRLPIRLYRANEIYYSDSMIDALRQKRVHTINGTKYVLVEFPMYAEEAYIERAMLNLQNAGYRPILAHAERYRSIRELKRIQGLIDMGVLIQLNTSSIMGKTGYGVTRFCLKLLRRHMVHLIGTDAHGSAHRRPRVQLCMEYLDKKVGPAYRRQITERNPEAILRGEYAQIPRR